MLEKLKSLLGLEQDRERRQAGRRDANVTVDRDPATASEDAVKGTQTGTGQGAIGSGGGSSSSSGGAATADSPATGQQGAGSTGGRAPGPDGQTGSDAATDSTAASTGETEPGSPGEEAEEKEGGEAAAAAGPETDADAEEDGGDEAAQPSADGDVGTDEDVTVLDGIGSAYSERLEAVDVETVADLADADAAAVAEETDLGENRVAGWIEQARER